MRLWQAILIKIIRECEAEDILDLNLERLFERECYKVIEIIKEILEDDSLEDENCFERIENIVSVFEEIGSDCGTRHDFG